MEPFIKDTKTDEYYYILHAAHMVKTKWYNNDKSIQYKTCEVHPGGLILYDNLFKYVQIAALRKLFLSMVPIVYVINLAKNENNVLKYIASEAMDNISNNMKGREYEIAYELLKKIPKDVILSGLKAIDLSYVDLCEFYLDLFAIIYYNTDRKYFMSLLDFKYKGDEAIKPFVPYKPLDLIDYRAAKEVGYNHKHTINELDSSYLTIEKRGIYDYKIIYKKPLTNIWDEDEMREILDKEEDPASRITIASIYVSDGKRKGFEYVDVMYNISISNKKLCIEFIKKHKKVILAKVLKNVDSALRKKKLDITSSMLKFDNITVTNDSRLVCKLSLKPELAAEVTDLTNEDKAILLFKKGLSKKEIAEKLGISYKTVCVYTRGM